MGTRREGELRLLKDGVVFGPTDRDGLERLLAAGRIGQADFVSVRGAEWVPIADYLVRPTLSASPALPAQPMASVAATAATPAAQRVPKKKGELRLLSGGRVISSLTRDQVEQLATAGRLTDDDLICALNGPWMRLGDFFSSQVAPPPPLVRASASTDVPSRVAPVSPPPLIPVVLTPPVSPPPAPPPQATFSPPLIDPVVLPQPAAAAHASISYPLARPRPPSPLASDEWFVRVRGIHSAPLKKQHVKALYQAREVTLDCLARHATWQENDWRPIHAISELAAITRP